MRLKPWPPGTEAGARWRWRARATRAAPWWSASAIRVLGCHRGRRHRSSTPSSRPRKEGSASACLSAGRSSRRTAEDFGHKRTTSTELRSRLSYLLRLRADSRLAFLSHRRAKIHGTSAFGTFCHPWPERPVETTQSVYSPFVHPGLRHVEG